MHEAWTNLFFGTLAGSSIPVEQHERTVLLHVIVDNTPTQKIDFISAIDVSRAFWQTHQHMDQAAGRVINVTKSADKQASTPTEVASYVGQVMEWPVQMIPSWVVASVIGAQRLQYNAMAPFRSDNDQDLPGVPPHVYMDLANHEKTFDNSLAKELLDFEAAVSWREAVETIAEEYRASL